MQDNPTHGLKAGQFTDDTSMALCLAQSLIDCDGVDQLDQMRKYSQWFMQGYMGCNNRRFLSSQTLPLQDHYIIIDGDYKGSVYELRNLRFGDDSDVLFDLDLVVLQYKEKPVTDIFLINYHFGIMQKLVGELVVTALKSYVDNALNETALEIENKYLS